MSGLNTPSLLYQKLDSTNLETPYVINTLREAYKLFVVNEVDDAISFYALNIISRYLSLHETVKESEPFYVASLYIASRHPYSYPNHETKSDLSKQLHIRLNSLEWYIDSILGELKFLKIYDSHQYPYFIDPIGIIGNVLSSVIYDHYTEAVIRQHLGLGVLNIPALAQEVAIKTIDRLKLVPDIFRTQLETLITTVMRELAPPVK